MKGVLVLVAGVAIGFVAAAVASRTPQGRTLLEDVDAKVQGFGSAIADGYRAREAELREPVA